MSMNREDETRKALRKDVSGPYRLPGLDRLHVERRPAKHEPTPQEMWDAYMKALDELKRQGIVIFK